MIRKANTDRRSMGSRVLLRICSGLAPLSLREIRLNTDNLFKIMARMTTVKRR